MLTPLEMKLDDLLDSVGWPPFPSFPVNIICTKTTLKRELKSQRGLECYLLLILWSEVWMLSAGRLTRARMIGGIWEL